jgi:hypothetical protein
MRTFGDHHAFSPQDPEPELSTASSVGGVRQPMPFPSSFACGVCDARVTVEDLWAADAMVWLDCPICGEITVVDGATDRDGHPSPARRGPDGRTASLELRRRAYGLFIHNG